MKMKEYLKEIEHAATETLRLVWSEREQFQVLDARIAALGAEIKQTHECITWLQANPDLDDDMQSTAMYWDSYFGPEKEAFHADVGRHNLELLMAARQFSTDAQSGNILQYAKQGISLVHRGLKACPVGRRVATLSMRDVTWQGRNQTIHWDEAKFTQPVHEVFETRTRDVDSKFAISRPGTWRSKWSICLVGKYSLISRGICYLLGEEIWANRLQSCDPLWDVNERQIVKYQVEPNRYFRWVDE